MSNAGDDDEFDTRALERAAEICHRRGCPGWRPRRLVRALRGLAASARAGDWPVRDGGNRPPVPYDDRSLEFERGVEYGLLWSRAKHEARVETTVHADLADKVRRLAAAKGVPYSTRPAGGDWLAVTIGQPDP